MQKYKYIFIFLIITFSEIFYFVTVFFFQNKFNIFFTEFPNEIYNLILN